MRQVLSHKFLLIFIVIYSWFVFSASLAFGSSKVEVIDSYGQRITLNAVPERIACLYAFSGHVVAMLGRGDDLVAIVGGLKKDKLLSQIVPGIKKVPVPSNGGIINIEELLKTEPDIVFLKPETAKIDAELKKLERFKIPYFVAGYDSMAEQMQTIEMIGKTVGRHEKALEYNKYYEDTIDLVKKRTKNIPQNKKIRLYHSINEPHRTDAPGTLEADWTNVCGVNNVSVNDPLTGHDNKKFAGIEQILSWNPEIIIVNEDGVDQFILKDKKWSAIKAVKNKKVFAVPVGISRWGHPGGLETPLAIIWTAKKIYPQLFTDINIKEVTSLFYKRFFGLALDNKTLDKILSGKGMRIDKKKKSKKK